MKNRKYIILIVLLSLISIPFVIYFYQDYNIENIDIVQVNDIVESVKSNWGNIDEANLPGRDYGIDYVILDSKDNTIASTDDFLNKNPLNAVKNGDTIFYIVDNDIVIGKIIFINNSLSSFIRYRNNLLTVSIIFLITILFASIIYSLYIDKSILKPFRKLQKFSQQISLGNFDFPLEMDKNNWFGSFTESFDIMRTELYKAKENERLANRSKKELVASLSHDIKTPIASIKSVCEVMLIKSKDENQIKQLEVINSKVEQINSLITNLFNATLEELNELKVNVKEVTSNTVSEIISKSDYDNKCEVVSIIPECLIFADLIRLEQVIDNIISNSYKYAGTNILVKSKIDNGYLEVEFKDFGTSIKDSEITFLANKYYRGENAKDKNGTGLGLYISNYLMTKMSGELSITNDKGFCVKLKLLIV